MNRPNFIFTMSSLFLGASLLLLSCGSSSKQPISDTDSIANERIEKDSPKKDYPSVELKNDKEVREFIHFKKFSRGESVIGFNRQGGFIDGEAFNIKSFKIANPKEVSIDIEVPSVNLSGTLELQIFNDSIILRDTHANISYQLEE